ncbi:MAG TPA: diol dehydratase small subunit [Aestuariivirga sp.]|nr:diol dehydratase small subunit [Aestuariivirga sp.]
MTAKLTVADYPLAETRSDRIKGKRGKSLDDITLESVVAGRVTMEDLRITPQALADQAEISRAAGRPTLALNFERAAELVGVPQDFIMSSYEMLRPGRAKSRDQLLEVANTFRQVYKAERMAKFIEEAADTYERRGLFTYRF